MAVDPFKVPTQYIGCDWNIQFQPLNYTPPDNFASWTIAVYIGTTEGGGDVATLSTTAGSVTISYPNFTMAVASAVTNTFAVGVYYIEARRIDSGYNTMLMKGAVPVKK